MGLEDLLEKEMATHSSILACRIPLTEESGRLQSMGSQRVGHDWATEHASCTNSVCRKWWSFPHGPTLFLLQFLMSVNPSINTLKFTSGKKDVTLVKQLHFCFLPTSHALSPREPGQFYSLKVSSHSLSWHGSTNMSMFPLQPHPSPFLFLPYSEPSLVSYILSTSNLCSWSLWLSGLSFLIITCEKHVLPLH